MMRCMREVDDKGMDIGKGGNELISAIICVFLAAVCCVISILQFREKGFLFNNAWLYASKQERENMDKKPHYRQSGIVCALVSFLFLCLAVEIITEIGWLNILQWIIVAVIILYAIISSIRIIRK